MDPSDRIPTVGVPKGHGRVTTTREAIHDAR